MRQPPEAEEPRSELLRQALEAVQDAWQDVLFNGIEDVEEGYGRLLERVNDLTYQTPADMREEAIRYANGSFRQEPVTMNSVVRMYDDYDDIRDPLREFFRTFGSFRKQFVERGALSTILWASKEMTEALGECTSFYHVEYKAASIDDI